MCELRTLPKARPLSWRIEVYVLEALCEYFSHQGKGTHTVCMMGRVCFVEERMAALLAQLPDGSLEYAFMPPADREARASEFSSAVRELVRAMEEKR